MKFLITGPESSGTRMVSRFIACLLGVIKSVDDWDGHWEISDGDTTVYHRSLPHGDRDGFPGPEDFGNSANVFTVICMRDNTIMYESALKTHNKGDDIQARACLAKSREKIKEIIEGPYPCVFFDYEAAVFLEDVYLDDWAKRNLGKKNKTDLKVIDGNLKYIK